MALSLHEQKKQLRQKLLKIRRAIPPSVRYTSSLDAGKILTEHPLFKQSSNIACYFSSAYEFDCRSIIKMIWESNKKCFLPVVKVATKQLNFAHYLPDANLKRNQFRILEPQDSFIISPDELDLILIPLVGFDKKGNRIGMGAGYYDYTLAHLKRPNKTPIFLGVGFEAQEAPEVPAESWDIVLDGVLTEKRLAFFR